MRFQSVLACTEANPYVLETFQTYRVLRSVVNPLQSQDFHLFPTVRGVFHQAGSQSVQLVDGELFTACPETLFRRGGQKIGARRSGRRLNNKDRLEALLCAETLQGTLSPNANPGKGSNGGLLNWMPQAAARIQQAAQTLSHLSSTQDLYQTGERNARGESKKSLDPHNGGVAREW